MKMFINTHTYKENSDIFFLAFLNFFLLIVKIFFILILLYYNFAISCFFNKVFSDVSSPWLGEPLVGQALGGEAKTMRHELREKIRKSNIEIPCLLVGQGGQAKQIQNSNVECSEHFTQYRPKNIREFCRFLL